MAGPAAGGSMRLSLLLAAAVLVASAAPTAQAARAQIVLVTQEGAVQADAIVPVEVTLVLSGFMCPEEHAFTVMLSADATAGVTAAWEQPSLRFTVPADTYFTDDFRQTLVANLTVTATGDGEAELTADLIPEPGPCFAPNGFDPASTSIVVRVDAPAGATPPAANETAPEANLTPVETNETDTNTTNASTETPPEPTPTVGEDGEIVCPPEGSCGLIGEFEGGEEESSSAVPGTALPLAAAVLAIAALAARRRKP